MLCLLLLLSVLSITLTFSRFLSLNRLWAQSLSYDQWAMLRCYEIRIIAINHLADGAQDPDLVVYSKVIPGLALRGAAPRPRWGPPLEYTQSNCGFLGRGMDHPRRQGLLFENPDSPYYQVCPRFTPDLDNLIFYSRMSE